MAHSADRRKRLRLWLGILVAIFAAACGAQLFAILGATGGHLVYSLDDAYIHLALAEQLVRGHYGVNPGELSAPSSSMLWPLLLAPVASFGFAKVVPLILGLAGSIACLLVFHRVADIALGRPTHFVKQLLAFLVALGMIPLTNLLGLTFIGMEHTLQLLLSGAVVLGLMREGEDQRVPPWLLAALVLGPFVRYENLAVSTPALLVLWLRGHRALVLRAVALLAVGFLAFTAWLQAIDIGLFPTSVQAKSRVVSEGQLAALLDNFVRNVTRRQGVVLAVGALASAWAAFRSRRGSAHWLLAWFGVAVGLLHMVGGNFGWHSRYEIYAMGTVALVVIALFLEPLRSGSARRVFVTAVAGAVVVAVAAQPYLSMPFRTVVSARENYEIHTRFHDFVVEYFRGPVAVCDLGIMVYRNPHYVLDLGGLANQEARQGYAEARDAGPGYMSELADRYGVRLAILYPEWFPAGLPESWTPVAEMSLKTGKYSRPERSVVLYATDEEVWWRLSRLLIESGELDRQDPSGNFMLSLRSAPERRDSSRLRRPPSRLPRPPKGQ